MKKPTIRWDEEVRALADKIRPIIERYERELRKGG
jgi:hypothetical protein